MGLKKQTDIKRFMQIICGKFSNKEQVIKNPRDFAHINIYIRELPSELFNGTSFYSEQSFNHDPWNPYRQSVQKLYIRKNSIILENYKIENSDRVAGGGFKKELLKEIQLNKLILNKGCNMHFREVKESLYIGKVESGKKCLIERDCKITYLVSHVEINKDTWISIDEGYDLKTNKKIWGSINGELRFNRIT